MLAFGLLDAYYLSLEREFRGHYDKVANRGWSDPIDLHISIGGGRRG